MKINSHSTAREAKGAFTAESLPDHPFFHGLSERHRQTLAESAVRATFKTGKRVVETGQHANCFYLVISGSIGLETPGPDAPLRIQTIGPGDILGWSWLFPPDCWEFNAVAEEPTEVIFFQGRRLREECDRDHRLAFELFMRMAQRHCIGKATDLTAGQVSTTSFPPKPDFGRKSFHLPARGNLEAFALKANPGLALQRDQYQPANGLLQVLLNAAKTAIHYVGRPESDRADTKRVKSPETYAI